MLRFGLSILLSLFLISCSPHKQQISVKTGLDRIREFEHLFANKSVGIVTNHTAYDQNDRHIVDIFRNLGNIEITALFGPEHGIFGSEAAGKVITDTVDSRVDIPVFSLYGKNLKPTPEMLKNVDILVFDIQDIGARFYTYMSTMALAMEAAAEMNIPFVVLDRPNPINGVNVEGNVLDTAFATFVGLFPVPVRHGMTAGELAGMINGEGWLKNAVSAELTVISLTGWQRTMWYDQTGLKWRPPSPNIPDLAVATAYPGICLFEGTNVSEGRGTYQPFLRIGAPWLNVHSFENINNLIDIPGLKMGPISFTPKSIPGMAPKPKHLNHQLFGLSLNVSDRDTFRPYLAGITLVKYFYDNSPESFEWREKHFDRLCGTDLVRKFIVEGKDMNSIKEWMDQQTEDFMKTRSKYLLYE